MKYFIKRYMSGNTGILGYALLLEKDGKFYYKGSHSFYKTARAYMLDRIRYNSWGIFVQNEIVYNKNYFQFKSNPESKYYWVQSIDPVYYSPP